MMNNLTTSQPLTMSSREIAAVVQSRHDNVKVTMNTLRDKGLITFTESQEKGNGRPAVIYHVGKRDSYVVVAQLSPEFTAVLVDRWQELESKQSLRIPQTYSEALQLAADQAKQLELAAPKVAFVDNYVETGTTKTLREVAKILKFPERKMITKLIEDKVLYRQSGNLLPYQAKHEMGLFDVKTGENGGYAFTQTRVTTKGIEWIANRYSSELGG